MCLYQINAAVTRREIELLDLQGKLKRNLRNPVMKDTILVPDGGYTIIRLKADNPGIKLYWYSYLQLLMKAFVHTMN